MNVIIEFANGEEKSLEGNIRFLEYNHNELVVWGGDDEMPVELYSIDSGRPLEMSRIRVWDLVRGQCTKDDGLTDSNPDIVALDARVTVLP